MGEIAENICRGIDFLTDSEGSAVNILSENPDFDGPNRAIECCGDWTNFVDVRFSGTSLHDCLEKAVFAKVKANNTSIEPTT